MSLSAAFPLLRAEGDHGMVGRAHGEAFGTEIAASVALYRELFASLAGLEWPTALKFARRVRDLVDDFDPLLQQEMDGIAAGADIDPLAVVALNARSDILQLAGTSIDVASILADEPSDSCTSAALAAPVTADGHVLLAQNWDKYRRCQPQTIVLQFAVADEPDTIFFTEAGIIVRSGLNSAGIGVTGNAMRTTAEFAAGLGIPETVVRRRVLRATSFDQAVDDIITTPTSHSINHLVADAAGRAVSVEVTPHQAFTVPAVDGLLVHANHFQAPEAASVVSDENVQRHPSTLYRDCRVRNAIVARAGNVTINDLQSALTDHFGFPDSVCKHAEDDRDPLASATIASTVMDLTDRYLTIAPGPACTNAHQRYDLNEVPT